jgi:hypothetical protein
MGWWEVFDGLGRFIDLDPIEKPEMPTIMRSVLLAVCRS